MADDVTNLSLGVDTSKVKTASTDLDAMAAAGGRAETSATALETASRRTSEALASAGRNAQVAGAAQAQINRNASGAASALNRTGQAAKLTATETAALSAQLQDLFVQIQAGGSPITALIQQGSNLASQLGGAGNAARAVASIFTLSRVAVGGAVAAIAAYGYAAYQGSQQSLELQRSLILTGNAAGLTEGRFNEMARGIADATKTTVGSSRDSLQALVATGRLSGDALEQAGVATQLLSKVTGQSTDDIVKQFAAAADAPLQFATQINRTYNILTAAQLEQIRVLQEQGRNTEALAAALGPLNQRLTDGADRIGTISKAWNEAKRAASAYVDSIFAIGRDTTPEQQLQRLQQQIAQLKASGQSGFALFGGSVADLEREAAVIQRVVELGQRDARQQAAAASLEQDRVAFNGQIEASKTQQQKYEDAIAAARARAVKVDATPAEINAVTLALQRQYGVIERAKELQSIGLTVDVGGIRRQLDGVTAAFSNAETVLEAQRQAFGASDEAYYATKRLLVTQSAEATVTALEAENARLRDQRIIAVDALDALRQRSQIRQQIADNEAQAAIARAAAAAQVTALDQQQATARQALIRTTVNATIANDLYVESLRRQGAVKVASVGLGDQDRARVEGLNAIAESYQRRREQLDSQIYSEQNVERRKALQAQLDALQAEQNAEVQIYLGTNRQVVEAQGEFSNGAKRALSNYLTEVQDKASLAAGFFSRSFKGAEDVLTDFLATGKADFKSFADQVIKDVLRIIVQQQFIKPLAGWLTGSATGGGGVGSFFSTLFAGGKADGGSVQAGSLYRINERGGPGEIFSAGGQQYLLAAQSGTINPNAAGASAGRAVTIVNNFALAQPSSKQTQSQIVTQVGQSVQRELARNG